MKRDAVAYLLLDGMAAVTGGAQRIVAAWRGAGGTQPVLMDVCRLFSRTAACARFCYTTLPLRTRSLRGVRPPRWPAPVLLTLALAAVTTPMRESMAVLW
jgi:hypothetical protein